MGGSRSTDGQNGRNGTGKIKDAEKMGVLAKDNNHFFSEKPLVVITGDRLTRRGVYDKSMRGQLRKTLSLARNNHNDNRREEGIAGNQWGVKKEGENRINLRRRHLKGPMKPFSESGWGEEGGGGGSDKKKKRVKKVVKRPARGKVKRA